MSAIRKTKRTRRVIPISGLWTRTSGEGRGTRLEVLIEVGGSWVLVQSHPLYMSIDQSISHITETLGIERAKPDPLGES